MPLYYLLESYTTLHLCKAYIHYTCKFIIHHILTISLVLTIFQYSFFNFFTIFTPAVHGFMNIGYYYSPSMEYIMCRWYVGATAATFFYFLWIAFYHQKARNGACVMISVGVALACNNYYTPELVQMCEINPKVNLILPEVIIHALGLVSFCAVLNFYSVKREKKKLESKNINL
jgi:hypothetical protein